MAKKRNKKELLAAIARMKKSGDSVTFLTDIGAVGVGAAGGGMAALAFGGGTAYALFGLVALPAAAPVAVVAGATALGGAALFGAKRALFDGTFHEGKKTQLIRQMEDELREIEEKERTENTSKSDKEKFHMFLAQPIEFDLITPEDAGNLMELVETGKIAISDAYKVVRDILDERDVLPVSTVN